MSGEVFGGLAFSMSTAEPALTLAHEDSADPSEFLRLNVYVEPTEKSMVVSAHPTHLVDGTRPSKPSRLVSPSHPADVVRGLYKHVFPSQTDERQVLFALVRPYSDFSAKGERRERLHL